MNRLAVRQWPLPSVLVVLALLVAVPALAQSRARVWEEPLVLPAYEVNPPDHNPRFYAGRAYQGAQGRIYPYAMIDDLTDNRVEKTYRAVYLENEYIKVCVVPELGGRVLSAVDKTNNYDFFYRQTVIKPALIGMIGAWISGGIEWNFPHHHRPTVFMPIDYTIENHPDGSATAWVGEMEIRHRMRWVVGLTLYPGKSYLEATLKPINRTPFIQSFLFFANAGTHANENYQVFFPPDTQYVTYHGKNQFAQWPVSRDVFNQIDYRAAVDLSWWKNHPEWTSMFAWNYNQDFFAGYDHGKRAGTVSVANHHVAPGKKFWEWSAGSRGVLWDHILTEKGGPELELMTGAYSDNQPDYSWLQPLESKTVRLYWYPIRDLGGLKYANSEGALNFELQPDRLAKIAVNTVAAHRGATLSLKSGETVLYSRTIDISPAQPFSAEVRMPPGIRAEDIRATLTDRESRELLAYQQKETKGEPMPDPVKPPPPPREIKTVEELYYAGLRLEQFYNPALEPDAYYEEALRRDPNDSRVNLAFGIRNLKRGLFEDAERKFRTALKRPTHNFTSPRDGEGLYYLGMALLAERHFNVWEGSRGLRDAYEDVYLLKGLTRFRARDYRGALENYQKALEFPLNLENASPYRGGRMPEIFYFIATAYEALKNDASAKQFYGKAVEAKQQEEWSDLRYYEAMALKKLGQDDRAASLLTGLMEFASVEPGSGVDFFSKFGEREPLNVRQARLHYLRGLVHKARGDAAAARAEFEKALSLDVNQLWARVQLGD